MPACGGGLLVPACGWLMAAGQTPCGLPLNGEGTSIAPPSVGACGAAFSPDCSAVGTLAECLALCADDQKCDAVSYGRTSGGDCYLKSNPTACSVAAAGRLCPWVGSATGYEYHMRCPCCGEKVRGCPVRWGSSFLAIASLAAAGYAGGGAAYNAKMHGRRGAAALPHREWWAALCAFAQGRRLLPPTPPMVLCTRSRT
eukprot:SAG11_NODE_1532_length_4732_cov_4.721563_9_plen_199_part_00